MTHMEQLWIVIQSLVWKRYRSTQASIDGVSPVMGGSSLENAVTTVCNYLGADYNAAAYMEQGYTAVADN